MVADNGSMYNTPPTYTMYIAGLVFQWIQDQGGLAAMEARNRAKAALLYDYLDGQDFYRSPVQRDCRSLMNVPFRLADTALDAAFLQGADERGLVQLKGHRIVGGMRASIYNAMPIEGVQALVDYMRSSWRAVADEPGGTPTLERGTDGVATLRLHRPQHLNRLHRDDLHALQAHCAALRHDDSVRVLVLTGSGRAFCAGFHLGELDGADDPRLFEHVVDALEALPMPTIARLNGSVYGGATDLALACDFRIGVHGMELRMPAARLGLHYYPSGLQRYVSRLGLQAAKRLFLLAESVDAADDCCASATSTRWWRRTRWTAPWPAWRRRCWPGRRWRCAA